MERAREKKVSVGPTNVVGPRPMTYMASLYTVDYFFQA